MPRKLKADTRIEKAYGKACSGVQIDIMDIGKIFAFGRECIARGDDDDALASALRRFVDMLNSGKLAP